MDRDAALERLPPPYAAVVRLNDAGADAEEIAARLSIAVEAVPNSVAIALAKLARLMEVDDE